MVEMELFVVAATGISMLWFAVRTRGIVIQLCGLFGLLAVINIHFIVDGFKWKWLPVYLLYAALIVALALSAYRIKAGVQKRMRKGGRIALGLATILYGCVSLGIGFYLLPSLMLEAPGGSYPIGTRELHWIDDSRAETYTQETSDRREVMIRLWYPADVPAGADQADYGFSETRLQLSSDTPFLYQIIGQSNQRVKSNSYANAPLSSEEDNYPVVVMSPGYGGSHFMYTTFAEELASQGYIVAGIQHPYFSLFPTQFPDGREVGGMVDLGGAGDWALSESVIEEILVKDVQFVLDQLEHMNQGEAQSPGEAPDSGALEFTKRMDFSRLGMMGHSFGGTLSAQVMSVDSRVKAGINMDGFLYGKRLTGGLDGPFMYMTTGGTEQFEKLKLEENVWGDRNSFALPSRDEYVKMATEQAERHQLLLQNGGYDVVFPQANHYDFSDAALYSPLVGSGNAHQLHDAVNGLIVAFFDRHLNGKDSPLLQNLSTELYTIREIPLATTK